MARYADTPPLTRALINVCIGAFVLQFFALPYFMPGEPMLDWFALWPEDWSRLAQLRLSTLWQLVTYAFLHGNLMHLAFNMFALWMFGAAVEQAWGSAGMARIYLTSVVSGALAQLVVGALAGGGGAPVVGASAGVFGLLLIYALEFPQRRLILLFLPIPIPARMFVAGYAALELTLGLLGDPRGGIAHFAHLGGLLGAGIVWLGRTRR